MTETTQYLIETSGLTKRYGQHLAVDDINLRVRRGEVYGFLGPNGAGKTTTMRMLLGLVRPTSGSAEVLGLRPGDPAALGRIGMLVETPAFYPYLSGRDNLRVMARYRGVADAAVEKVLRAVDLFDRSGDKFSKYSLGMKQRLGVASAMLGDPELLILDEPTNGLDPAGVSDMRRLIRALADAGHTVLLSSHMLAEVQQLCDRAGVISKGKFVAEGTVAELRGHGALMVSAQPQEEALRHAERILGSQRVSVVGDQLRLDAEPEDAARINRELVTAGLDVTELRWAEKDLEDVFFEMTGSSGIASTQPAAVIESTELEGANR